MKKCSVCERTYEDEKISFCTACGGSLVVEDQVEEPAYDPFKTMIATPPPPKEVVEPPPPAPLDLAPTADDIVNPSWESIGAAGDQPVAGIEPSKTLALGSMICGLVSLFCGLTILGPVGAILGIMAVRKEKENPSLYGGRTFAMIGIVSGALGTLLMFAFVIGMIFYLAMGSR